VLSLVGPAAHLASLASDIAAPVAAMETPKTTQFEHRTRQAKLNGGVAVIRIGAATEAEAKSRKEAFEDAVSATKAAVAEGVVPGGGLVLLRAIDAVKLKEAACEGSK